jgi:gluconokinase
MKKELFMGIDIGTSSVRAVNFDRDGNVCGAHQIEYTLICDEPGMAELDPDLVFSALIKCVRTSIENAGAEKTDIAAIGISTQMHSIMAVDEKGVPVTNLMTWADTRPMAQAEYIAQNFDTYALYQRTGCRNQHPMYPLSKICWLRDTHPETYAKVHKFLSIKSYVLSKLYGEYYMDYSDAGASACFNLYSFDWDEVILGEVIGISKDKFPNPVPCDYVLKGIKSQYAKEMNLCEDVTLAIGSGDGMMANLGCGVFDDTRMSCTVGTSGALRILVKEPLLDLKERTWCYSFLKDGYLAGGAINNGGIVLKWLREEFKNEYTADMEKYGVKKLYQLFDEYAKELPAGSEGLIMLPYLTGERSPGWRADAKAVISGITLRHGRKHFAKAAMESVMYQMHSVFEAITSVNNNVKQIIANGGYASSDVWLQIQADIFNRDIAVSNVGEASAFGAAYTAMIAAGVVRDFHTGAKIMEPKRVITPNSTNVEVYRTCYQEFRKLYEEIYSKH